MHCHSFQEDIRKLGYDLLLSMWLIVHTLPDKDLYTYFAYKLCLLDIRYFEHTLDDNRDKDRHCIQVCKCIVHSSIEHLDRTEMDCMDQ
jgi:hypothetical protein